MRKEWLYLTDALTAVDTAKLLGYHCTSVNDWAAEKELPAIDYYGKTIIAKEHLIQFISQTVNRDREDKSKVHLRLIERFLQHEKVAELLGNSYSSTSLIEGGD